MYRSPVPMPDEKENNMSNLIDQQRMPQLKRVNTQGYCDDIPVHMRP